MWNYLFYTMYCHVIHSIIFLSPFVLIVDSIFGGGTGQVLYSSNGFLPSPWQALAPGPLQHDLAVTFINILSLSIAAPLAFPATIGVSSLKQIA